MRKPTLGTLKPDPRAAVVASMVALVVLVAMVLLQGAVAAAFTSGTQPMIGVDQVPQQSTADVWDDAPNRTVSLEKQQMAVPFGGGSTDELTVKAVTNESHVAFRLGWDDPTNDTSIDAPGNYSDAAAIMFKSASMPPITMGAGDTPVNIWYWRSAWEYGQRSASGVGDMYAYPHPDDETRPGLAAGNPLSETPDQQYAHNYYAKGFGSLSHAPVQPVTASATRADDRWTVTFVRERGTNGTYDAAFDDSEPMYLAFAVWNGSADEVNSQKSITLQFTELDMTEGSLAAADQGGDGGSDDGGPTDPAGLLPNTVGPWIAALVGATLLTWLVAYRRVET